MMARRVLMMVLALALGVAGLASPRLAHAATYYVDASSGDDTASGVSAGAAWRSLARVGSADLAPGDSVLLRRGQTWREALTLKASGAPGRPITVGAFGAGPADPVISGADLVDPGLWRRYRRTVYVAHVGKLASVPNQLYVDGRFQEIARYPSQGFIAASAASTDKSSIMGAGLGLSPGEVVGATLVARSSPWSADVATVSAYDPAAGRITLGQNISYKMPVGYGFYLRNKPWMLLAPGQWCYDPTTGDLYLRVAKGDDPARHAVEIAQRQYGVRIGDQSYVRLTNLRVTYPLVHGVIVGAGAQGDEIDQITVRGGSVAISLACQACSVTNSTIQDPLLRGIKSTGAGATLSGNRIDGVGALQQAADAFQPTAIDIWGAKATVDNNMITNTGSDGIAVVGHDATISNNRIDRSCIRLDDCAGIHTGQGAKGALIVGNMVTNSIGSHEGTTVNHSQAQGIYLDNDTNGAKVRDNVVRNADFGLYIHDGFDNEARGNRVHGARMGGLWIKQDEGGKPGYVRGNLIVGNVFETLATSGGAARYDNRLEARADFGTINDNLYCHPNSPSAVSRNTTAGSADHALDAWRQASGQDSRSTDMAAACPNAAEPGAQAQP